MNRRRRFAGYIRLFFHSLVTVHRIYGEQTATETRWGCFECNRCFVRLQRNRVREAMAANKEAL